MKERLLDVAKCGLILVIAGAVVGTLTHFSEFGILGTWITALATAVIAYHAVASHVLSQKIRARDEEFRQQVTDLYQALIIITAGVSGPTTESHAIKRFKELYKGNTPISLVNTQEGGEML
jgi:hypothetical protein